MKRRNQPTKPEHKRRTNRYPIPATVPGSLWERVPLDLEAQARVFNLVEKGLERDPYRSTN